MNTKKRIPKNFIVDVDGVMTDGQFHYSVDGKVMKVFGPEDSDALSLIKDYFVVHFVTGDKRGFEISKKRIVDDMKLPLDLVSTFDRVSWIKEKYGLEESIYMGDGLYDVLVFKDVAYSISPANGFYKTREAADFVTNAKGGEGAVAEACFHLMEKFHQPIDLFKIDYSSHTSAAWSGKSK